MLPLLITLLTAQVDARAERVIAAMAEKDCPKLFDMLSEPFQKQFPKASWATWCAKNGKLTQIVSLGTRDNWLVHRARSGSGPVILKVAFKDDKISGLAVNPELATLDAALAVAIAEDHVPGIAAMALNSKETLASAAAGVRKLGDPTPVGADDKWHLGSDAKAMTATLAAMLVDEKKLKWSSTVTEVLGAKDIHPDYAKVTLELLLQHRGGLPANLPLETLKRLFTSKDPAKERMGAVREALKTAPSAVGTFAYSNLGYAVVGAMLERASGVTWEALIVKRLLRPLAMNSCGFGAPATAGKVDQPWGHLPSGPVPPGPESDNPPAMGPAGTLHCSLADWARFARLHLAAARGEKNALVSAESIAKLQTAPAGGDYAMGWLSGERPAAGGLRLAHDGSNTMFFASIWIAPKKDLALLIAANAADEAAQHGVHQVLFWLIDHYAAAPETKAGP